MNSINIGKFIVNKLRNSEELSSYIDETDIAPIFMHEDRTLPYIVFYRNKITPSFMKGGAYEEDIDMFINIYSEDYEESCEIASIVCKLFNNIEDEEYGVSLMRLVSSIELKCFKIACSLHISISSLIKCL